MSNCVTTTVCEGVQNGAGRFPATSTRSGGARLASGAANGPLMAIKSSVNSTQNQNLEVCCG